MLILSYPPEDLITYGDFPYYFALADLSSQNFFPFLDYWQEYPPVFPYLNLLLYQLAGQQINNYIIILATFMLVVDGANLYLIYRLGVLSRGPERALQLAWIYTALFVPIYFLFRSFDGLTTFFLLLGVYALVKQKNRMLVVAMGIGAMVKILPIFLVATIFRSRGWRAAVSYGLGALAIALLVLLPFAWANPTMTQASLLSQPNKSSYETIWALIDGNYTTGSFGPLADHFDADKATQLLGNPARIPSWLTFIPFGLLGLFILTRPVVLPKTDDILLFTTITFVIFFLWSPGWSPQWQTFLIPLLLLAFPERRAILFIIVLSFINFLEWPVLLSRGLTQFLPVTVLARTLLHALIAFELYQVLTVAPKKHAEG